MSKSLPEKNIIDSHIIPKEKGVYITGGTIRDLLIGRTPADYDIAVTEHPEKLAKTIAEKTSGTLVKMGKHEYRIFRVVSADNTFDVTRLTGKSIEEDLANRDFTINAIAYEPVTGNILDPVDGTLDLKSKKIRMVSKEIFKKDPVRLVRAYRISACFGFDIEPQTASVITSDAQLIQNSTGERIRSELFKIFHVKKSYHYILQMANTGVLTSIFPELSSLKECLQNKTHDYDVFEHTMKAYHYLETVLNTPSLFFPQNYVKFNRYIDSSTSAICKLAVLLHDIGKPSVKTIDDAGNIHFYGHAAKSAQLARKIGQRLKLSNKEADWLQGIIRYHIRPLFLFNAHRNNSLTSKGITRFFLKCADITPALLLHTVADTKAKEHKTGAVNQAFLSFIENIANDFFYNFKPKRNLPPFITGHDLINRFGLVPSPLFKTILNLIEEARLTNNIKTKSQALSMVDFFLKKGSKTRSSDKKMK